MATESPIRIVEGKDKWPPKQSTRYAPSSAQSAIEDLGLFLKGQSFQSLDIDVIPSRSGSAPPSMEGSISAIESLFSKRKSTLNPGLINPNISPVNSNSLQFRTDTSRIPSATSDQSFGGSLRSCESSHPLAPNGSTVSDRQTTSNTKYTDNAVQLPNNRFCIQEEESEKNLSYGQCLYVSLEKSVTADYGNGPSDATQENSNHALSLSCDQTRPMSHQSTEVSLSDTESHTQHDYPTSTSTASVNSSSSHDSNLISSHDDTKGIVVEPSQHERDLNAARVESQHIHSAARPEALKIVNASSSSNLDSQNNLLQQQAAPEGGSSILVQPSYPQIIYPGISHAYGSSNQFLYVSSNTSTTVQPLLHSSGFTSPLYGAPALLTPPSPYYPNNMQPAGFFPSQYGIGGYTFNPAVLPTYMAGYIPHGAVPVVFNGAAFTTPGVPNGGSVHAYDIQNLQKFYGQRIPLRHGTDPFHLQYIKPGAPVSYGHQTLSYLRDMKKEAEHVVSLDNNKHPHSSTAGYSNLNPGRCSESNHYSFSVGGPPTASVASPSGRCNMSHSHSPGGSSKFNGLHNHYRNDMNLYSLLEELKTGKGQRFQLSDIWGYIVELSVDQHGSRFIQQRLETCQVEEKASFFKEVIPYASNLMTDVFGNYVIQKLFEYGSPEQRKDLAEQLKGQILPLSLQMYGCRVVQKALDVIDSEQKVRLVKELDGHVTRCVRDQNGNHVIQKCIESIPSDNIHFIISSFRGQVATLSMHPYGCRVIQRVLEHCKDESQTQFIVDEIVDSVSSLAQDQYGNYVTQHLLERSKPRERRTIIEKLSKSIVQLSQHKFASNVVEKCLEYSDSTARDMLIKEIVGRGDKHDNLWIMMKDQYANYVIQKIIQKSTSDQRKMLLGLIRNHLAALKKYTYGKHIVSRFEELYGEEIQTTDS